MNISIWTLLRALSKTLISQANHRYAMILEANTFLGRVKMFLVK